MPAKSHGLSRHPLYRVWQDIKRRCYDPKFSPYNYYGGQGVTVCQDWLDSPEAFITWALLQKWEPGMDIDKDTLQPGNKVYSPETCRVISHQENMVAVVGRGSGRMSSKLKLTQEDVEHLVRRSSNGETYADLGRDFNVAANTVSRAVKLARTIGSTDHI